MLQTAAVVSEEAQLILSTVSPGTAQKRMALAVVVGLLIVFVLITAGPLGSIRTNPVAAFVPAYATAMFVCDSITAILLFAQFSILRSRAILVIASGYLFTALMLIPWILAFPGVFTPNAGLIGGLQTTSWLYFAEHAGLPVFAIGYALSKDADADKRVWPRATHSAIALSVAVTAALVSAVADWARSVGCLEFASDAALDNEASHAVHRALGFAETERVVFFRKGLTPHNR